MLLKLRSISLRQRPIVASCVGLLGLHAAVVYGLFMEYFWMSNLFATSVPDDDYSRNM